MSKVDAATKRIGAGPRRTPFQRFCAWTLTVFGVLFTIIGLVPAEAEHEEGARLVLGFGIVLLVCGGVWLWSLRKRDLSSNDDYADKAVLAVAARHGGRATLAQIVHESELTVDEAEITIDRLCRRNVAQPDLLDDGSVIYTFGVLR